jgi:hypothetical protein
MFPSSIHGYLTIIHHHLNIIIRHVLEELRTTSNGNLFTSLKEIATLTPKKADQMQCSMPNEHAKLMAMELLDMLGDQAPTEPREVCCVYKEKKDISNNQ